MELLPVVETLTIAFTLVSMVSGIPSCLEMYRTGDTKNVMYLFFLVNIAVNVIGIYYGQVTDNFTMILLSTVGALLWGLYVLIYIGVSRSKIWPMAQVLMLVIILLGHKVYLQQVAPHPPALTNTLGFFLFVWSLLMLLTPVLDIVQIVRRRSAEGISMPLMVGSTLSSLSWLAYGYLLHDIYVYGPSILGLSVNFAMFTVMGIYSRPSRKAKTL